MEGSLYQSSNTIGKQIVYTVTEDTVANTLLRLMEQALPIATSLVKPASLLQNVGKTTMTKMANVQAPLRYSSMTAKLKESMELSAKNNWTPWPLAPKSERQRDLSTK